VIKQVSRTRSLVANLLSKYCEDPHPEVAAIYPSTKKIFLYGSPNLGSRVTSQTRVEILKLVASVVGYKVPPKLEKALASHSDELRDLSSDFVLLKDIEKLPIESFYETKVHPRLGTCVSGEAALSKHDFGP
jgi:hypothetical protein